MISASNSSSKEIVAVAPLSVVQAVLSTGVVMLAVAPLFAVLGGSLMLELAVPVLRALTENPGQIDARAAMAFFMIGAVHVALMVLVLKVAGTMVAVYETCGQPDLCGDLPCPTPEEPPCTSYTIC